MRRRRSGEQDSTCGPPEVDEQGVRQTEEAAEAETTKDAQGAPQRETRSQESRLALLSAGRQVETRQPDEDYEVVAQELSKLAEQWRDLEVRVAEVERVNARLEDAALTTARALGEVSRHWDAVYDAMRRVHKIDRQVSSERDNDAARTRRSTNE